MPGIVLVVCWLETGLKVNGEVLAFRKDSGVVTANPECQVQGAV